MVEITTATVANSSERAAATSYLWGQTSTGPIVERLFAATDFMTKNANSHRGRAARLMVELMRESWA